MYAVELTPHARRQLDRLPHNVRSRTTRRILALENNPRPPGVKKLRGRGDQYRIRAGVYRIIYMIEAARLIVTVIEIAGRGEAYRGN